MTIRALNLSICGSFLIYILILINTFFFINLTKVLLVSYNFVFIDDSLCKHMYTHTQLCIGKFIKALYKTYVRYKLQIPRSKGNAK